MTDLKWWQKIVFYQIYPRSFADGNGDGIGDLYGAIEKLDYLKSLGVEGIWLSPHYPSPNFDVGYDIADYTDVDPDYGDLATFRRFLEEAHARDMRVILDLVLNHTSHEHPWFKESASSLDNPKRDWYIWRAPSPEGGPPNNWESTFGGSAWEFDPITGQYYYHYFLKEQPDLNWRNLEVKAAMWAAVRFWLEMGVDGFRLDAIDTVFEDPDLPNHTADYSQDELYRMSGRPRWEQRDPAMQEQWRRLFEYQRAYPGIHELFQELRQIIEQYDDRMLVGETDDVAYYGNGSNELHLAFNFPLMRTKALTPAWIRDNQHARLGALPTGAWPCNCLGNHDRTRVYSAYSGDEPGQRSPRADAIARLSLALMLTLRGTPFLYNGEEIGMSDYILNDMRQCRDTMAFWYFRLYRELFDEPLEEATWHAMVSSRDKCRTPMQWSAAPNGGFCPAEVKPWLPVNPNFATGINVAAQEVAPDSMLAFYRRMIALRQNTPALVAGDYAPLLETDEGVLAFLRDVEGQTCLVVLNYSGIEQTRALDLAATGKVLFVYPASSDMASGGGALDLRTVTLPPYGILVVELTPA
ncbi:MAG: alpha-glucosidase [Anaerolineae bacterium]|nr:alpha-glucosidase [Anaerolineae bacterium]